MWTCPKCDREFKTKNQWHSCVKVDPESLFADKPTVIKEVYHELLRRCISFGKVKVDTTKSCIYFVHKFRYLALKPRTSGLFLEFILNRKVDVFPVIKIFEMSKNQVVHRLKLDGLEDINDQVMGWIEEAFHLKNV